VVARRLKKRQRIIRNSRGLDPWPHVKAGCRARSHRKGKKSRGVKKKEKEGRKEINDRRKGGERRGGKKNEPWGVGRGEGARGGGGGGGGSAPPWRL